MVKTKPNQKFHIDKLNTTLDKLEQLELKPKSELTLCESIHFLRGKLNSAIKKGYSYQDLSEILAEQNILISAATLKLYLTQSSKSKKSSTRKIKSLRNSTSISQPTSKSNSIELEKESETNSSNSEINSMPEEKHLKQVVKSNSTTETKLSNSTSNKDKTSYSSNSNKSNRTKAKTLSNSNKS